MYEYGSGFAHKEIPIWFYRPEHWQANLHPIQNENIHLIDRRGPPCRTCAGDLPHLGEASPYETRPVSIRDATASEHSLTAEEDHVLLS